MLKNILSFNPKLSLLIESVELILNDIPQTFLFNLKTKPCKMIFLNSYVPNTRQGILLNDYFPLELFLKYER